MICPDHGSTFESAFLASTNALVNPAALQQLADMSSATQIRLNSLAGDGEIGKNITMSNLHQRVFNSAVWSLSLSLKPAAEIAEKKKDKKKKKDSKSAPPSKSGSPRSSRAFLPSRAAPAPPSSGPPKLAALPNSPMYLPGMIAETDFRRDSDASILSLPRAGETAADNTPKYVCE
jgi:hypothetical protein